MVSLLIHYYLSYIPISWSKCSLYPMSCVLVLKCKQTTQMVGQWVTITLLLIDSSLLLHANFWSEKVSFYIKYLSCSTKQALVWQQIPGYNLKRKLRRLRLRKYYSISLRHVFFLQHSNKTISIESKTFNLCLNHDTTYYCSAPLKSIW